MAKRHEARAARQVAAKAASLATQPAQSVPALPCLSCCQPAVVRPVSANGVDEFCERARQGRPEGLAPTVAARRHPLAEAGSTACVAGRCVSIGAASRASECPNPLRAAAARSEHAWAVDGRRGVFLAQRRECLSL
jgi:hypothetical protein